MPEFAIYAFDIVRFVVATLDLMKKIINKCGTGSEPIAGQPAPRRGWHDRPHPAHRLHCGRL
jgi:hypothetical protein